MKKMYLKNLTIAFCFILTGLAFAGQGKDDLAVHKACKYCGMNRVMYDFSRVMIEYDDGTTEGFCSLRCAAVDLANNIDKAPKAIWVGDFNGRQLIDAEKAFWVVGGARPGVMTRRGKWAFEQKEAAENFLKVNQGKLVSFEEAMKMAYEDMYEDTKMIRDRRKAKRMKMGNSVPPAPDVKYKCPVCGMSVAMFADWNTAIVFTDNTYAIFDSAKCMFKYYLNVKKHNPAKGRGDVRLVSVKDYYTKASVDAREAFFVVWSDIYGPMGHEPIPFARETNAQKFQKEHNGKKILKFKDIDEKLIMSLDNPSD